MTQSNEEQSSFAEDYVVVPPAPRKPTDVAKMIFYRFKAVEQLHLFYGLIPVLVAGLVLMPSTFMLRNAFTNSLINAKVGHVIVKGSIMGKRRQQSKRVEGQLFKMYGMKFEYTYNNKRYKGVQFVWEKAGAKEGMKIGQSISVEFSRYAPKFSRIAGLQAANDNTSTMVKIVLFVILSLLAMSGYWVWRGVKPRLQRSRVYRKGIPIQAEITALDNNPDQMIGGQNPVRLSWRFFVNDEAVVGSYSTMRLSEIKAMEQPGEGLVVLYDPKNPKISIPYV